MTELNNIISALSLLPGVGKKSASRIAYYLIKNKDNARQLAQIITETVDNIINCSVCGNFTINDPCPLCSSSERNDHILCIVEDPKDLLAVEETGYYNGRYHILMGSLNPLEGVTPDKLRIKELLHRIDNGNFEEILIATNPTTEGEATFLYIKHILENHSLKISRIATGIPMGGSLEYSDKLTLGRAIQLKQYINP